MNNNTSQQQEFAVINLSKLGFRYFRIVFETKYFSKKIVDRIINHPNTGYVFEGSGWSGKKRVLGFGLWATSAAEINDVAMHIRSMVPKSYKLILQSELTRLEFIPKNRNPMVIVDEFASKDNVSHLEQDYLRLVSIDPGISNTDLLSLLETNEGSLKILKERLKNNEVFHGVEPHPVLSGEYTKLFIDTTSLNTNLVEKYLELFRSDPDCHYIGFSNGRYNVEVEYDIRNRVQFRKRYGEFMGSSKQVIFDTNHFTNLFPQSKFINNGIVKKRFQKLIKKSTNYFDLRESAFWYVSDSAAQAYLDIYKSPDYKKLMNSSEVQMFEAITNCLPKGKKFNTIDLGSGDGTKGYLFNKSLGMKNIAAYFPVDISQLEIAQAVSEHQNVPYQVHPTVLSFDDLDKRFPIGGVNTNIYMLFGGTYGNFHPEEINGKLKPLLKTVKDYLVVAMPTVSDKKSRNAMLKIYLNKEAESVAMGVIGQLGFARDDFIENDSLVIQARYEGDTVVTFLELAKRKDVEGVTLEKGAVFEFTQSWKPTKVQFRSVLEKDFTIIDFIENKGFAAAVLAKR